MRNKIFLPVCALALTLFGQPAAAAEPAPGSPCSVLDQVLISSGPENSGDYEVLRCNGLTWQHRFIAKGSAGDVGIRAANPQAPLDVGGEAIIGATGIACQSSRDGALRYTSTTDTWEFCDGSAWVPFERAGSTYCQPRGCFLDGNTPATNGFTYGCFTGRPIKWTAVTDNGTYWTLAVPSVRIGTTWRNVSPEQESAATYCRDLGRPWHDQASNGASSFDMTRAEAFTAAGDNIPKWYLMSAENNYAASYISCEKTGAAAFCPIGGAATEKIVFATSQTWTGNLGGVAGANAKCQAAATTASLAGTFKAWISDDQGHTPAGSFAQASVPYKLVTGAIVANSWTDLVDGTLQNAISVDENGNGGGGDVWTGTTTAGNSAGGNQTNCNRWASSSGAADAWFGNAGVSSSAWTGTTQTANTCDVARRLYCFEQ
jgi:hypothetical protein